MTAAPELALRRRALRPPLLLLFLLAVLGLFLATQYPQALRMPFIGDDFLFLEKTQHASFASLWEPRALAFFYYRPWSRELHYWVLQRLFDHHEPSFHLANMALWLAAMGLYFSLVRRLAGAVAAAVATGAVAALASWSVLFLWAAGSQDLWMLVFALASLLAFTGGRTAWATVFLAGALLSKETAGLLPLIALAWSLVVERRSARETVRRNAPLWLAAAAWTAFHPFLLQRLLHPSAFPHPPGVAPSLQTIVWRTLRSVVSLDPWPRPLAGWAGTVGPALAGASLLLLLLALVWLAQRRAEVKAVRTDGLPTARLVAFGAAWTLLAWLPLLLPSLGWQAYYGLLGTLGAWLTLALWLRRRPWAAAVLVVALSWLRVAQATTPSNDWGSEWFQWRAMKFGRLTRAYLHQQHPSFPRHSRVYVTNIPGNVGLVPGGEESPALRVWYGDSTLETRYASRYHPRTPGEPPGKDYFFIFEDATGWREVVAGPESLSSAQAADSLWEADHMGLASLMWDARDWRGAGVESEKLARVFPDREDYAFNVGQCAERLGDSTRAAAWYRRAASLPRATEQMRSAARRFQGLLRR